MSVVKVTKVATTQVAGGAGNVYGFCVSVHSEDTMFNFLANIELDTSEMSEGDAEIVNDFITLVNSRLAAS